MKTVRARMLLHFIPAAPIVILNCSSVAFAQSDPKDDYYLLTDGGCKFVNPAPKLPAPRELRWSGECVEGFVSGSGELTAKANPDAIYRGEFEKGLIKEGTLAGGGYTYRGQFENNLPSGQGEFLGGGGSYIKGTFKEGKPVGPVEIMLPNRDRYVGPINWETQQMEGNATYYFWDGTVYEGMFKNNQPNGPGVKRFATGEIRRGVYVDGRAEGHFSVEWADGSRYDGEFNAGSPNGKGIFRYPSGDVYEGEFVAGQRHGKGKYVWATGDVYEGEYAAGEMQGRGRITWARGGAYEGEFVGNMRHGYGRQTGADGMVKEGEWKHDELNGKCHQSYPDGETYDGYCVKDRYEGQGHLERTFTQEIYDGEFRQGTYHGKGLLRIGEYSYEGEFKYNKKDGQGKERHPDGTEYEGDFVQDYWHGHGLLRAKSPDGVDILYDGEFARGAFDGEGTLTIGATKLQGEFRGNILVKGTIAAPEGRIFEIDVDAQTIVEVLPDGSKRDVEDLPADLGI